MKNGGLRRHKREGGRETLKLLAVETIIRVR